MEKDAEVEQPVFQQQQQEYQQQKFQSQPEFQEPELDGAYDSYGSDPYDVYIP